MRSIFGPRARAAIVLCVSAGLASAGTPDTSQLPRDDSTGPGSSVGSAQAPWKSDVESVRQQIPVSIANARTETYTSGCGAGYAGVRFQTRLVKTFTNGVVQADAWSALQGECVALPSASRGAVLYVMFGDSGSGGNFKVCPAGFVGDPFQGSSSCFWSKVCPAGQFTPTGYGSWQDGGGEGPGSVTRFISSALCIQP